MPNIGPMGLIVVRVIALLILGPKWLRPQAEASGEAQRVQRRITGRDVPAADGKRVSPLGRPRRLLRRDKQPIGLGVPFAREALAATSRPLLLLI
jgi:hypothetical protein